MVDDAQVEAVLSGEDGAAAALPAGVTVVLSSTVPAAFVRDLAGRLAERGLHLLDPPVSGGAAAAEAGEPTIMASGPAGSLRRRRCGARGRRQDGPQLGAAPGIGSTIEAVNQLLAGINLVIAAEGMAFGVALGADPKVLYEGDPRRRRRLLNVR
ncbi:MAG: NAD(P)-binding domain-containing protein [Geminicoccaceae bacterium]